MKGIARRTCPVAIVELQGLVNMTADMTRLRRRIERIDSLHDGAEPAAHMTLHLEVGGEAHIGDLAPPQSLHRLDVQVLEEEMIVRDRHLPRELHAEIEPLVGGLLVGPGKVFARPAPVVRALLLPGERPARPLDAPEASLERLGRLLLLPVREREIRPEPEIGACAFTRHGAFPDVRQYSVAREYQIDVSESVSFYGKGLDDTLQVSRLVVPVELVAYPYPAPGEHLVAGLGQRE